MAYIITEYFDCFSFPYNGLVTEFESGKVYWFRFTNDESYELSTVSEETITKVRTAWKQRFEVFSKQDVKDDVCVRVPMSMNPLSVRGKPYKTIHRSETKIQLV